MLAFIKSYFLKPIFYLEEVELLSRRRLRSLPSSSQLLSLSVSVSVNTCILLGFYVFLNDYIQTDISTTPENIDPTKFKNWAFLKEIDRLDPPIEI